MIAAEWVSRENLLDRVCSLKKAGYRFVTVTCVGVAEGAAELLYHFDRDFTMLHLRLATDSARPLPSVSAAFPAAYLVENEIQDHFGLAFSGLSPDFRGTLFVDVSEAAAPLGGEG